MKKIYRKKSLIYLTSMRVAAAFVLCSLLSFGLAFSPKAASAWFLDTEASYANVFAAGALEVGLSTNSVYSSPVLYPTDSTSVINTVSDSGTVPLQYTSSLALNGINNTPCMYVTVTGTNGTQTVTAPLTSFITAAETLATPSAWTYTFSIDAGAPPSVWGKTCFFKWVYTAWQASLPDASSGFTDTEERLGSVRIGKAVVLNEFITNPLGADNAPKPGGEWVELYNNSSIPVNVAGWYVYDNDDAHGLAITGSNTNTAGTIVPAHGWLVVYRNGDANFELDNAGDSVRLYTGNPVGSSVLVDNYTYNEEKPEGFSFARMPDGVGDWVDPDPTPGKPNVVEVSEAQVVEPVTEPTAEELGTDETVSEEQAEPATTNVTEQEIVPTEAAAGLNTETSEGESSEEQVASSNTPEESEEVIHEEQQEQGTTEQDTAEVQSEPQTEVTPTTEPVTQQTEETQHKAPDSKPAEEVTTPEPPIIVLPDPVIPPPPAPTTSEGGNGNEGGQDA